MFKPSDRLMQDFSDYPTRSKKGEHSCDFLDGTPRDVCNKTHMIKRKLGLPVVSKSLLGAG